MADEPVKTNWDEFDVARAAWERDARIRSSRTLAAAVQLLLVEDGGAMVGRIGDGEFCVTLPIETGFSTIEQARRALAAWTHVLDLLHELLDRESDDLNDEVSE